MTYTGVDKSKALENLSARIQEDLSKAGLNGFYYKVEDVSAETGIPDSTATTSFPEDATPEQRARVEEIANRHIRDFLKQRYNM